MNRITVTTCGTSILTNSQPDEVKKTLIRCANNSVDDYLQDDAKEALAELERIKTEKRNALLNADLKESVKLSAELNGFISYYLREGTFQDAQKDTHYLIQTDTYQGESTAEMLKEWGERNGIRFQSVEIKGLNTRNVDSFRSGISHLIDWCGETLVERYGQSEYCKVIFNLVGGFKSLQGYMQTLGMFYADETIYIFETGGLLSIPRLPVDFNSQAKQEVRTYSQLFRRMEENKEQLSRAECKEISETMLNIKGKDEMTADEEKKCELSAWGKVIWTIVKKEIYSEKRLEPLSSLLRFTDTAERRARQEFGGDKLVMTKFNLGLDRMSRYLNSGRKDNLNGCRYRKMGSKYGNSDYEFTLWDDQGGMRAFCHEENGIVWVDDFGHRVK